MFLRTNFGAHRETISTSHLFSSKFKSSNLKSLSIKYMAPKNDSSKSTRSKAADIKEIVNSSGMLSQASSFGIMTKSKTRALSQMVVQHALAALNTSSL